MPSPFDDIFGGSGPQWTWEQMQARLDAAIARERLPRDLVYALVKQESNWDPYAVGDGGRAKGFFQLHPGAAQDAGIDPAHRDDVGLNIDAGTRYLRLKLDQAKGNEDRALQLYNGGGDPNYVANVRRHLPQHRAQPTLLSRAASVLSPASAEAATPKQGTSAAVWDDIFGAQAPAPAMTPRPPTARSTPEEDAAYRQGAAQQPAGATTPPAPVSQTPAPPGASQGPPGPSPADEQYAAQTIAQMRQRQTPHAPVTDPAALLAVGGGPTTPQPVPPPVTDPAALLAGGGGQAPVPQTREQQILAEARARQQREGTPSVPLPPGVPTVAQETLTEGFTTPSTLIPLVGGIGAARVALTPLSRLLLEPVAQTVGEVGGRWWETGTTPTPHEALETFAWNLVPSAGEEALRGTGRAVLRRGTGGQMLLKDEAARQSQGMGMRVMQAPERAALARTFDEIARTNAKLDISALRTLWGGMTTAERTLAVKELRRINSTLADTFEQTGGQGLKAWNIGDLQDLRSTLIKRRQSISHTDTERRDILSDLRSAVDDAIDKGITVGTVPPGFSAAQLKDAQAGWRKMRLAEDLQDMVTKHTSFNPNTQYSDLNLAALKKELQGTTPRSKRVLSGMDEAATQRLQGELDALSRNYPFVKIPSLAHIITTGGSLTTAAIMAMTGQPGPAVAAAIPAALSLALQSPKAMSLFKEAILRDRGELRPNTVALIIDTARRELGYGAQEPTGAAASGATR